MDAIFRRLIDHNLSELPGLALEASIPVPERLVNEILGAAIRNNKTITYGRVSISRNNRVSIHLKTTVWPWPLELMVRVDRSVDLLGSPKVRARLENQVLLARLGSFFKLLPGGVSIQGDRIVVDLGSFIASSEAKGLLELIDNAEIVTEEGRLVFEIKARVAGPS